MRKLCFYFKIKGSKRLNGKKNPVLFWSKTIPEEIEIYKPDSVTPKGSLSFI
jgi:hypothetical protein